VVVVGVLAVLVILLLVGVINGDDTDVPRRQDPQTESASLLS
jgi:hypothetical protein